MQKQRYDRIDGKDIFLYTIEKDKVAVDICELGARINALKVGGVDIVLGFNSIADYVESDCYAGATVGRVANRIAGGKFLLGGKQYNLNTNSGNNHLHGGITGFDKKLFTVKEHTENSVTMEYISADGEENYPGNLTITVKFTVEHNALIIDFTAVSDKDTLWSPTNHAYFNLDGEQSGDIRNNLLQIYADYYTPTDDNMIPTGEKIPVENTLFDFNNIKPLGAHFGKKELFRTVGYDHNYVLSSEHAARAESDITGIIMDVYTDLPCMQLYSGGHLFAVNGKSGVYNKWSGFCLEPQFCPNAVNMDKFEQPILKCGEKKSHYIRYHFHHK